MSYNINFSSYGKKQSTNVKAYNVSFSSYGKKTPSIIRNENFIIEPKKITEKEYIQTLDPREKAFNKFISTHFSNGYGSEFKVELNDVDDDDEDYSDEDEEDFELPTRLSETTVKSNSVKKRDYEFSRLLRKHDIGATFMPKKEFIKMNEENGMATFTSEDTEIKNKEIQSALTPISAFNTLDDNNNKAPIKPSKEYKDDEAPEL